MKLVAPTQHTTRPATLGWRLRCLLLGRQSRTSRRAGLAWRCWAVAMIALILAPAAAAQSYAYDAAGRLIRVAYVEGGGVAYAYDETDNMTAVIPLSLPAAPVEVQVTRLSPTSAQVTWQADASATGYVVERRRLDSQVWEEIATIQAGTTTFTDLGLEDGVDYAYRVAAVGADGRSAYSPEATFSSLPTPAISQNGVVNGASFAPQAPVSPGSIVSIFGENIGVRATESGLEAFQEQALSLPLPRTLAGYKARFGSVDAPLFFVGGQTAGEPEGFPGQINAQVPWEVPPGPVDLRVVQVDDDGSEAASEPVTVNLVSVSPALFTFEFGGGRAAAVNIKLDANDDVIAGSIAQPANAFPGSNIVSQPAAVGGAVAAFANGLGPVDPPAITGQNSADALRGVTMPVQVFVGDIEAQVLFAGLTPEFAGLYQINFIVPQGVVPGDAVPIRIVQGGVSSRNDVTLAVRVR